MFHPSQTSSGARSEVLYSIEVFKTVIWSIYNTYTYQWPIILTDTVC